MMFYVAVGSLFLFMLVSISHSFKRKPIKDSALKQRSLLYSQQQHMYQLLQCLFPQQRILMHVHYGALITTKYAHTKAKYLAMSADFVVLDESQQVVVVIAFDETLRHKRQNLALYQDNLLKLAGYWLIRYEHLPSLLQLSQDLLAESKILQPNIHTWKHLELDHFPTGKFY